MYQEQKKKDRRTFLVHRQGYDPQNICEIFNSHKRMLDCIELPVYKLPQYNNIS